jgi:hypothetical protein
MSCVLIGSEMLLHQGRDPMQAHRSSFRGLAVPSLLLTRSLPSYLGTMYLVTLTSQSTFHLPFHSVPSNYFQTQHHRQLSLPCVSAASSPCSAPALSSRPNVHQAIPSRQRLLPISNPEHQVSILTNSMTKPDSTVNCGGVYWGDEPKSDDIIGDDNCHSTMPFNHFKLVEECDCTFWKYVTRPSPGHQLPALESVARG